MWIISYITYILSAPILTAIEYITGTACDIDGINESVFTEGICEVPKGFFVAGSDEIELVIISSL